MTCFFPLDKTKYGDRILAYTELDKLVEFDTYLQQTLGVHDLASLYDKYEDFKLDEVDLVITYLKKKYDAGFDELMEYRANRAMNHPSEVESHRFKQGKSFVNELSHEWDEWQESQQPKRKSLWARLFSL